MKRFDKSFTVFGMALWISFWALFSSCEQNSVDPGGDNNSFTASEQVKATAQISWQTLHQANTQQQFSDMVNGEGEIVSDEIGMINNRAKVQAENAKFRKIREAARHANISTLTTGDTLIWFEEWTDPVSGISGKRGLFYNTTSGDARLFEVLYNFPADVQVRYDSTSVKAFLGPDFDDPSDDQIRSVDKQTLFKPGYNVVSVESNVTPTEYDDMNEIISATAENIVTYSNEAELTQLVQNAAFNHNANSMFSELLSFDDGTTHQKTIVFTPNNTGTFSEIWRDGTTVEGDFNDFEDDYHGAVRRVINFASHPHVSSLAQSAEYTFNPSDSSSEANLREIIHFTAGNVDSSKADVIRRIEEGIWKEHFRIRTNNEGQSNFTIAYYEQYQEIEGNHTDVQGLYYLFNATEYEDGSGELWMKVYASQAAFNAGDPPILSFYIRYNPDGSGKGEVTEEGVTYQVVFSADGEIQVVNNDGERESFNAYAEN